MSTWVYSMNAVSGEVIESIEDFGENNLNFHGPVWENLSYPPMKINFQKNFFCHGEIGSGTEGKVYKCRFMGAKFFAVKKVESFELLRKSAHNCETSEVNIMSMLNHSSIIQFYNAWAEPNAVFIGMELCERTLEQYLNETSQVDLEIGKSIFMQITAAVEFMHEKGVVHRDIKPGNVLLDGLTVKLADFGIAKRKRAPDTLDFPGGWYGSRPYRAPEIVSSYERHNEKVDIFSIGMIYYEIFMPGVHKRERKVNQLSKMIREGIEECHQKMLTFDLDELLDGTDIFEGWEGDYRILKPMIRSIASERPSATQILELLDLEKEGLYLLKAKAID